MIPAETFIRQMLEAVEGCEFAAKGVIQFASDVQRAASLANAHRKSLSDFVNEGDSASQPLRALIVFLVNRQSERELEMTLARLIGNERAGREVAAIKMVAETIAAAKALL